MCCSYPRPHLHPDPPSLGETGTVHFTWLEQGGGDGDAEARGATTVPPPCRKGSLGPRDACPGMRMGEGAGTPREEHLGTVEDNVERMDQWWVKGEMKEVWGDKSK